MNFNYSDYSTNSNSYNLNTNNTNNINEELTVSTNLDVTTTNYIVSGYKKIKKDLISQLEQATDPDKKLQLEQTIGKVEEKIKEFENLPLAFSELQKKQEELIFLLEKTTDPFEINKINIELRHVIGQQEVLNQMVQAQNSFIQASLGSYRPDGAIKDRPNLDLDKDIPLDSDKIKEPPIVMPDRLTREPIPREPI